MYQQQRRELMERTVKHIPGFPGLMEKVKLEPVIENKKTINEKASKQNSIVAPDASAGQKKVGRPKKTVI
jgi:hypothetical protein